MSTSADLYPALSQVWVITLLVGLFDHQARCLKAEGGSAVPTISSTFSNVIGTSASRHSSRWASRDAYFKMRLPFKRTVFIYIYKH